MTRWLGVIVVGVALVAAGVPAYGQTLFQNPLAPLAQAPPTETKPGEAKPEEKKEEKPKTLWEENTLFAYIENSAVWNMGRATRGNFNDLRVFDNEGGYTFNAAEFSIKKDPSELRPYGYGLALTAGLDAQKIRALGMFRDDDDASPFRNTAKFDVKDAYGAYTFPLGSGLTVKAGKFVTLLGYEVIEGPLNPNFSRSFMFGFSIPFTHVGALLSYSPTEWLTITAGPVVGWDVARDNNSQMSGMGQFALTPIKDLPLTLSWITGPEQARQNGNPRTVLDWVGNYTGIKGDRKSTRLNSSHLVISYAVFCLKKKKKKSTRMAPRREDGALATPTC